MRGESGDPAGATRRPRDWPIFAGLLVGMLVGYAGLAYALYAVISAVF